MIKIDTNNKGSMEIDHRSDWTIVDIKDSEGSTIRSFGIEDSEMVSLMNYFAYQKDNKLPIGGY